MQAANPSASRSSALSRKRYRLPSLHITVPCGLLSNTSESGNIFGNLPRTFSPFARSIHFKTSKRKMLTNRSFSSFLQKGETPNHSLSEKSVPYRQTSRKVKQSSKRNGTTSLQTYLCFAGRLCLNTVRVSAQADQTAPHEERRRCCPAQRIPGYVSWEGRKTPHRLSLLPVEETLVSRG